MPALFGELQKQYGESLPSDENIRSYLLKHGFTLTAVDTPIRAYRETMELVTSQSKDYNIVEGNKPLNTSEIAAERVAREVGNLPPKVKGKQIGVLPIAADSSITISADGDVTQEGLDRLIDYIKLIKPSFPKTWL
jgi:hypothetical protein